jgi:dipeptidyl aminopeptidase/acylaminoacyl peptidase
MPPTRREISDAVRDHQALGTVRAAPRQLRCNATHLFFLAGRDGTLYSAPLDGLLTAFDPQRVEIKMAAEDRGPMSKEEELLRERLRNHLEGISAYHLGTVNGTAMLFVTVGARYYLSRVDGSNVRDVVAELTAANPDVALSGAWMDVKHHPTDLLCFTFVLNDNLYVATLNAETGGMVRRVTTIGTPERTCAVADYIMQEEFKEFSGNWWAPQQPAGAHVVLFSVTDVSEQRTVTILDKDLAPEQIPFPRVGDRNAVTSLVVASAPAQGGTPAFAMLPDAAIKHRFPWAEYLVRRYWRDTETLYVVILSRDQQRAAHFEVRVADLIAVKEEQFFAKFDASHEAAVAKLAATFRVVRESTIDWAWVEMTDDIVLGESRDIIGAHDTDGDGPAHYHFFERNHKSSTPAQWKHRNLGAFGAVLSTLRVASDGALYFLGRPKATVQSLCVLPADSDAVEVLTPLDVFVTSFTLMPQRRGVAYVASTLNERPFVAFAPAAKGMPSPSPHKWLMEAFPLASAATGQVTFGSVINSRGSPLHYRLHVPEGEAPAGGWPLMVYVYGGPHIQLVNEHYGARCDVTAVILRHFGVAVATVDNQMNHSLGLRAHAVCKHNMGRFETADYVAAVKHLVALKDGRTFNVERVGVFGWSYGGYATLLAMCQAPQVFKLGFAGAPVSDWLLYDTGYTERYMGLIPEMKDAYARGSVAHYAESFPDEPDRLFIAHGSKDENVHLTNTNLVIDALVQHNKPYSLLLYPGERHGLRQNPQSKFHYDVSLVQTVLHHL